MQSFFDYIFFRTYDFYKKKGSDIPADRGIQLLSLIQALLFFLILIIADLIWDIIDRSFFNKYTLGLPVAILIIIFNEIRYKRMEKRNHFSILYERWQNENHTSRTLKGFMIVAFPALIFVIVPVSIFIFKRLI